MLSLTSLITLTSMFYLVWHYLTPNFADAASFICLDSSHVDDSLLSICVPNRRRANIFLTTQSRVSPKRSFTHLRKNLKLKLKIDDGGEFVAARPFLELFFREIDDMNVVGDSLFGEFGEQIKTAREYTWLRWMDRCLENTSVGELTKRVLEQVPPILNAWAKRRSKFSALMIHRIIMRMVEERQAGNENAVVTTLMCNTLIDAWSRSGDENAALRCEGVFKGMIELTSIEGKILHNVKPDVVSYTTVISAWAKTASEGSAERAADILNKMEAEYEIGTDRSIKPNVQTYNTVLDAYARVGSVVAATKAENLLQHMNRCYMTDSNCSIAPDVLSYNSVIFAWANALCPHRADFILEQMESFSSSSYKLNPAQVQPNKFCYTTCINAYAKSDDNRKAIKAYKLLQRSKRRNQTANEYTYTAVLNACAYSSDDADKANAFDIACDTFEDALSNDFANHATYLQFFICLAKLLPNRESSNKKIAHNVFKRCCKEGQLNEKIFCVYNSIIKKGEHSMGRSNNQQPAFAYQDLPEEWKLSLAHSRKSKCNSSKQYKTKVLQPRTSKHFSAASGKDQALMSRS